MQFLSLPSPPLLSPALLLLSIAHPLLPDKTRWRLGTSETTKSLVVVSQTHQTHSPAGTSTGKVTAQRSKVNN